jgi:regulator of sirC expression with transglutaminase-like and TPR domain
VETENPVNRSGDQVASWFTQQRREGRHFDLARCALKIATDQDPALDIEHYLSELDALATRLAPRLEPAATLKERLQILSNYLCRVEGFTGNHDKYYAPENSYLSHVLERRQGLPITLAVVYVEVARRAGLDLQGVEFPSHFLIRAGEPPIFIDAFNDGELLNEEDCAALLKRFTGGRLTFHSGLLAPVTNDRVLLRILRNLKLLHVKEGRAYEALRMVDRLIAIDPSQKREYRDRGLLCMERSDWRGAVDDLRYYLGHVRGPKDELFVRAKLALATKRYHSVN